MSVADPLDATVSIGSAQARAAASDHWHLVFDQPRFGVEREVARGGMGRVLEATDRLLGRKVAIKVCLTRDPRAEQRLGREAAILALFDDPSIPPVHELGQLPNGAPYFVTRLIEGETLEQLVTAPARRAAALAIVADVAEVMSRVHRRGVVHRDLKPSNILVEDGHAWIIDWGIARVFEETDDRGGEALHDLEVTHPGAAIGTPGYWSPEQRRGGAIGAASDIYSLGAIVSRLATTAATSRFAWLLPVIARATATDPGERYASAADLAADLRRGLARMSPAGRPARSARSRRIRTGGAVLGGFLALALLRDDGNASCPVGEVFDAHVLASRVWRGDFGTMVFAVDGARVTGAYSHDDGRFEGTIEGNRMVGRWCEAPYAPKTDTGEAAFVFDVTGSVVHARGQFRYADDQDWTGRWNLDPVVGPPPGTDVQALRRRLSTQTWSCAARG